MWLPSSKLSSARNFSLAAYFGATPPGDLALEVGGVGAQRLQHRLLVLAEQRLHEHRRVAQIGRHAHLGDADEVRLQNLVMDVAALEQFAQDVAHLLADAEQADRAAFGGFAWRIYSSPLRRRPSSKAPRSRASPSATSIRSQERLQRPARSSTSNTSRKSPGLMSLVSASVTPHSRPGEHFVDVVLEAPQRGDRRLVDDDVVAREAGVEALADDAFE